MAAIQPTILTWARETAGLSLDDAAHALDLNPSRGRTGGERLAALEAGEEEPSRPLLLKMVKTYRRPLLVFYLAEPPKTGDRGQDFRTLPGQEQKYDPDLDALVRDIKVRQGIIRSVLEDTDPVPLDFIGSVTIEVPFEKLSALIAKRLDFSVEHFRSCKTPDEAFTYLRAKIEAAGVFVLLLGNLGSHHTNIPVEIFRGFALADPIAPMIVINDGDARAAWSFTALHELVHLWLGATGISGGDPADGVEQYCNDVAGEILLPLKELRKFPIPQNFSRKSFEATIAAVSTFAAFHQVSRAMVSYKLLRADMIPKEVWSELNRHFREQWLQFKQQQSEKQKAADGGPNYYVVRRHRVGPALLGLVRRSLDEGTITYTKASRVLGVKPRNVEPLLAMRGSR
jgi:Zn-dependent peptidase ImmA (M78 family)